jgi:lipoprotein-anchoring transpeptidase ErfK/SrfK
VSEGEYNPHRMRRRLLATAGFALALFGVALSAGGAYAYFWDTTRTDVIAAGVTVAGIDVGGLRAAQARALLDTRLVQPLQEPVRVDYAAHSFLVHPSRAGLRVDVAHMVEKAVALSRRGDLAHRVYRELRGRRLEESVPLRAAVQRDTVDRFVDHVARVVDVPPRPARVVPAPTATRLHVHPSVDGVAVRRDDLRRAVTRALLRIDGARTLTVPTRTVHARWTTDNVMQRYPTLILVSRETFTLRLYKHLKLVKTYGIAVGQAGLETPAGFYTINDKQVDPWWHVPNSAWAGDLAGRIIPPGPQDPIKSRWMGFYNGAGIHGTDATWSIGTAASHGCVRMTIPDVEDLYNRVPLKTPIYVG